jgi:chromosomal replication initiation ATPase DnaA
VSLYGISDIGSPAAHQAYREIEQLRHHRALLARLARQRDEAKERAKAERIARFDHMMRTYAHVARTMRPYSSVRKEIIAQICDSSGFTFDELAGPSRRAKICKVRQELMCRLKLEAKMSSPQIGALLNRDHTTVLHALRKLGAA